MLGAQREGRPLSGWEDQHKDQCHQAAREGLRRGPVPGLAGRIAAGDITEGFLVVSLSCLQEKKKYKVEKGG